jgi:molybdopterin adenylyltransferase
MSEFDPVRIGVVSISDRASGGVYEDKGIPALQDWLGRALKNPVEWHERLIPDEQDGISAALRDLVDVQLRPGADHRRHRPGAARRHARGHAGGGRQGDARLRRADAPDQPGLRAHGHPVAPGGGDPRPALIINLPGQPKSIAETLQGLPEATPPVHGIFAAVPYCIDLIGGPYLETDEAVCKAFRPKSAIRAPRPA